MGKKFGKITKEEAQRILLDDLAAAQNEGKIERLTLDEAGNSLIEETLNYDSRHLFILEIGYASGLCAYQVCRVIEREGKAPMAILERVKYDKTSDISQFRKITNITPYEVWIIEGVSNSRHPFVPVDPELPQYAILKEVIARKMRTYNGRDEKLDRHLT
jgi:hypothetical protein